jgi:pentatricopeptide repeat-containing protein PET309
VQVSIVQAAHREEPHSDYAQVQRKKMLGLLQELAHDQTDEHKLSQLPRDPRSLRRQTHNIGRAVHLMAEVRDFETMEELINTYQKIFPRSQDSGKTSAELTSAVMDAYLSVGSFDKVSEMWESFWQKALASGLQKETGTVYPAYEYNLCRPLDVMIRNLKAENDGEGLLKCIQQVVAKGFKLTSRIWNLAILELCYMGQWDAAMQWCETMLMPHWRGWDNIHVIPTMEKRYFRNNRVLRPSRKVVLALQAEWLRLYRLAAWSPDVSRELADLKRNFPRLHHAFTQSEYMNIDGQWILEGKVDVQESIDKWLRRLARQQLKALLLKLRRSSAQEKTTIETAKTANPDLQQRKTALITAIQSRTTPGRVRVSFSFPPSMSSEQMAVLLSVVREELAEREGGRSGSHETAENPAAANIVEKLESSVANEKMKEEKSSSQDRKDGIVDAPPTMSAHLVKRYPGA